EPDVVTIQVYVDEASQFAFVIEQAFAHSGMVALQIFNHSVDGVALSRDLVDTAGEASERRGNSDSYRHRRGLTSCETEQIVSGSTGECSSAAVEAVKKRIEFLQPRIDHVWLCNRLGHCFERFVTVAGYRYYHGL